MAVAVCRSAQAVPVPQHVRQVYLQTRKQALQLAKAGRYEQAIATAEAFMRQYPDSGRCVRGLAVVVAGILSRNVEDEKKRREVYQRAYDQFEAATDYYSLGAQGLVRDYLWGHGGVKRDPQKAADMAQEVIDHLGDRLSRDYYLGYNLYMLRTIALRYAEGEGGEAALKFAKEAALAAKDPEEALRAAKFVYVVCDFKEDDINRATEIVTTALTAARGPGAALQFAKSQGDAEPESRLKDVKPFKIGDPDKLLEAVGDGDRNARINVFLATGQTGKALEEAVAQLRQSAGAAPRYVAAALNNLARCFKAHDLNLIRANQFLDYNRTGEGENPLPELQKELGEE